MDIRISHAASLNKVIPKYPKFAIGLLETLSRDKEDCVRKAAAHALPTLVDVNLERATALIETLSKDDSDLVQEAAVEALSILKEVSPECAMSIAR